MRAIFTPAGALAAAVIVDVPGGDRYTWDAGVAGSAASAPTQALASSRQQTWKSFIVTSLRRGSGIENGQHDLRRIAHGVHETAEGHVAGR